MLRHWLMLVGSIGVFAAAATPAERGSPADVLIERLLSDSEPARAEARQMLPRQGAEAVPKLLPLLSHEREVVWRTTMNILADIANGLSAPGRERERADLAAGLMSLLEPGQPAAVKERALRLAIAAVPEGFDVGPIAALLGDRDLAEKARVALFEIGTTQARAALREYLPEATPAFQCAIVDALGQLHDAPSVHPIAALLEASEAPVRAAALRALAWTGDPSRLEAARKVLATADGATKADVLDAMIRLIHAMELRGGDRKVLRAAYLELLTRPERVARYAGLAGLGRVGDGTCVEPVLATLRGGEPGMSRAAIDSLRQMRGADVARSLVAAYPALPPEVRLALLPVLGGKRHPVALPILREAAGSGEQAVRLAALRALAEAGFPEGVDILAAASRSADRAEKAAACDGLFALASDLREQGQNHIAGKAYLAALVASEAGDVPARSAALEGLAACPIPEAGEAVRSAAADERLREPAMRALLGVAAVLTTADRGPEAIGLYEAVRSLRPPIEVMREVARGLRAAGAMVDLQGLLGTVVQWHVVGPFELGPENEGWSTRYVNEPDVDLVGRYMSGNRRVAWTPVRTDDPNGRIDLRKTVANQDRCVAYAYTEIEVREPIDAVLLIGADDSEIVWVNGQKVFETFVARGLTVDQDRVPVRLVAGRNRILMKIWQNTLGWEFCVRIVRPDGTPVEFAQK